MYVCICNGLTDKRIKAAIENGARSADEVYRALGCRPQCGQCVDEIHSSARRSTGSPKVISLDLVAQAS
ncbi:MAG: (2Fe-2S)-binding protein [Pseudomonadota bacterium]